MDTGIRLIENERQRQISQEGYLPEHDDIHVKAEILLAARCYVGHAIGTQNGMGVQSGVPLSWPWDSHSWKPSTPIRDLAKAGALIAAELDRLNRSTPQDILPIGSTVRLKSGGPLMSVVGDNYLGRSDVMRQCKWFDLEGNVCCHNFRIEALKLEDSQ